MIKEEPFSHNCTGERCTICARATPRCRTGCDDPPERAPHERPISDMLGKDAPIVTNARGGKQCKTAGRFDAIPGEALIRLAGVLEYGATKYTLNNWRRIEYASHINHAVQHLAAMLADDRSDDHLGHALCRLAMAVAVEEPGYRFTAIEE